MKIILTSFMFIFFMLISPIHHEDQLFVGLSNEIKFSSFTFQPESEMVKSPFSYKLKEDDHYINPSDDLFASADETDLYIHPFHLGNLVYPIKIQAFLTPIHYHANYL
ncbi:hypothetical protein [Metabacillus arenae]|uniref:Uncharacterized protein n=1 Tax=Metabacillus arenae TaxID=2771434 RepID=A0A926RWQ3_9BACI|nr:hypothetical protein [Metabacillus arenae]MBD1381048.1 hypothetical protein [Metabacillus arenae]